MKETQVPGISISVGVNGKIVWSKGFGYTDIEQNVLVYPSKTLFRIGSVSKPITSVALGILMEKGLLDVTKPIQEYVPNFPVKRGQITTKLLAGHLSGIRNYKSGEYYSIKHYSSVTDGLALFKDDTLLYNPGDRFSYTPYGWNLISSVIEGASGENYLDYMYKNIFKPLNLTNIIPDRITDIIPNRGRFYKLENGKLINSPFVDNSYKWAGGGYLATSEDLVSFGHSLLKNSILKKETKELLWEAMSVNTGQKTIYGFGWASRTDRFGRSWVGHNGGSVGGSTFVRIYPEQDIVIAITANMTSLKYRNVPQKIFDVFYKN